MLAIVYPVDATLAVELYLGWLFLLTGLLALVGKSSTDGTLAQRPLPPASRTIRASLTHYSRLQEAFICEMSECWNRNVLRAESSVADLDNLGTGTRPIAAT